MKLDPVRFSNLKAMGQSAAHYKHRVETESQSKRNMRIGTTAHTLVLGGDEPVIYHGSGKAKPVRNGKAWEEFRDAPEHAGKLILLPSEYDAARACADAVLASRDACAVLDGEREQELPVWSIAGRSCGGRPDVVSDRFITDLKTSTTAAPGRFVNQALRMAYHAQIAWYLDGNAANGGTAREGYIVAVETVAPYVVTVFQLTERALEMGRRLYSLWFEQLRVCEESGTWPPYALGVVPLDVPDEDALELVFGDEEDEAA